MGSTDKTPEQFVLDAVLQWRTSVVPASRWHATRNTTRMEINEIAGGPSHHLITDPHVPMWITSSLRTALPVRQSRKLGTAAAGNSAIQL
jgi:hypothetical protein